MCTLYHMLLNAEYHINKNTLYDLFFLPNTIAQGT